MGHKGCHCHQRLCPRYHRGRQPGALSSLWPDPGSLLPSFWNGWTPLEGNRCHSLAFSPGPSPPSCPGTAAQLDVRRMWVWLYNLAMQLMSCSEFTVLWCHRLEGAGLKFNPASSLHDCGGKRHFALSALGGPRSVFYKWLFLELTSAKINTLLL